MRISIRVEAAIVFGASAHSVDLLILSPDFADLNFMQRLDVLCAALDPVDGAPEVQAIGNTPEEYATAAPDSFLAEIRRTGRMVSKRSETQSPL